MNRARSRLAVGLLGAAASILTPSARSVAAGQAASLGATPPPLTITHVETDQYLADTSSDGGAVYLARTTAAEAGAPDGWLLRFDFAVRNNGSTGLTVARCASTPT